jgi:hypothetical protein
LRYNNGITEANRKFIGNVTPDKKLKYDTIIGVKYTAKKKASLKRDANKRGVTYSDHIRDLLDRPLPTAQAAANA